MPTPQQIANEINLDPANLGYAQCVQGDDAAISRLLNAAGYGPVQDAIVTRGDFMLAIMPVVLALADKDAATQSKWDRVLRAVHSVESIRIQSPVVQAALQYAIADGLMNQELASSIGVRQGSRAEVLWGTGTVVSNGDIAIALRGA